MVVGMGDIRAHVLVVTVLLRFLLLLLLLEMSAAQLRVGEVTLWKSHATKRSRQLVWPQQTATTLAVDSSSAGRVSSLFLDPPAIVGKC